MINHWAVNRDKEIWGDDADTFNPKRFLTATKEQIAKGATSFGIGARSVRKFALLRKYNSSYRSKAHRWTPPESTAGIS